MKDEDIFIDDDEMMVVVEGEAKEEEDDDDNIRNDDDDGLINKHRQLLIYNKNMDNTFLEVVEEIPPGQQQQQQNEEIEEEEGGEEEVVVEEEDDDDEDEDEEEEDEEEEEEEEKKTLAAAAVEVEKEEEDNTQKNDDDDVVEEVVVVAEEEKVVEEENNEEERKKRPLEEEEEQPKKKQKTTTTTEDDDDDDEAKRFRSFAEFNEGSWYVVGPPGSGKTTILKTFLWDTYQSAKASKLHFYPNYTTTIREELANFKKIIPKPLVSAVFKVAAEKRISDWLNENFGKKKKVVVIYDDICSPSDNSSSSSSSGKRKKKAASAWAKYQSEVVRFGSRHYKAHYLITTQYYTVLDTTTRSSFTYLMCICKMADLSGGSGGGGDSKKLKEIANIFKCDVDQLIALADTVMMGEEEFDGNDRLVIVYNNQDKNFRWNLHRRPASDSDEMKRYVEDYLLEIPQCFIKNRSAKMMRAAAAAATAGEEGGEEEEEEEEGEEEASAAAAGEDLEKELTKISMLQSISKINPKAYELLNNSKRMDIIEKEYLKAKAMLNLRNKLNIFMILYDLLFVTIEYVDRKLLINQCEGLTSYRDSMSDDDKNTERDIVNSVIECYAPYLNQPSPLTDLTLHTVTVILLAKAHSSMSRIVNTVASQLERCDRKCRR
uniref:Packaging ATPase n=1 Tax=Carcinus maenas virus 1 TaxID=2704945 RepID=A0A6G9HDY9_9VIRU|nr:packaging ATPase [Carcinus maenas virus 1]